MQVMTRPRIKQGLMDKPRPARTTFDWRPVSGTILRQIYNGFQDGAAHECAKTITRQRCLPF